MNTEFTTDLNDLFNLETISDSQLIDLFTKVQKLIEASKDVNALNAYNFYTLHYRRILSELDYRSL